MPRLPSSLLRSAACRSKYLPRLLLECRDLNSAENELRWLTEFAHHDDTPYTSLPKQSPRDRLNSYVDRRSKGEPLQYILGTQPFGELEILCRPGVLIPRPETESYTTEIAKLIISVYQAGHLCKGEHMKIADLCTGTGCIALFLHSLLNSAATEEASNLSTNLATGLQLLGVDISSLAVNLAKENLRHNVTTQLLHTNAEDDVEFCQLDVLALGQEAARRAHCSASSERFSRMQDASSQTARFLCQNWPVVISNPPYISPRDFRPGGTTARSVREYEPKLALVPPQQPFLSDQTTQLCDRIEQADVFYQALLYITLAVKTELILMEVGDASQAVRVIKLTRKILSDPHLANNMTREPFVIETWRDDGAVESWRTDKPLPTDTNPAADPANVRAVVVWRGAAARWRNLNR